MCLMLVDVGGKLSIQPSLNQSDLITIYIKKLKGISFSKYLSMALSDKIHKGFYSLPRNFFCPTKFILSFISNR